MKTPSRLCALLLLLGAAALWAQDPAGPARRPAAPAPAGAAPIRVAASGDYASDIAVVREAQDQALQQAKEMLEEGENPEARRTLETAIQNMQLASRLLDEARSDPEKLPGALAAQQTAYQALLKSLPREHRITRSRSGAQSGGAGQPDRQQLDQLEMRAEENRYETERQATAAPTPQQREQSRTAERLKQLAQRQQDLNDRLRELQTALQEARSDPEREEIQRQLKRLRDEERQLLADVDELSQRLDQSPEAGSLAETRQQLDRTRSDIQRAAQELERESISPALAAGARAQERLREMREELRQRSASQFTEQMRQLRSQARELSRQEDEVARGLEALDQAEQRSLRDSPARRQLVEQMNRQQDAWTNLVSGMRTVTEQAEATEPLLAHQLYDTLRRADQMRTDNLLEMGAELVNRGFLPQASEAERSARQNINEVRQGVERAAESVLGNETAALRFARGELDDLSTQVERELAALRTNSTSPATTAAGSTPGASNRLARADGPAPAPDSPDGEGGEPAIQANAGPGSGAPRSADGRQPGEQNGAPGRGQGQQGQGDNDANAGQEGNRLRQIAEQLGGGGRGVTSGSGPITGDSFMDWSDRLLDVEQALDPAEVRNQLATVRERTGALRAEYRQQGRAPPEDIVWNQILTPMSRVRVWLREELARREDSRNLVPLDRDPVPDNYSELVRKYYETLGSAQ